MTKAEYDTLSTFSNLPCFDQDDPNCESIEKTYDSKYTGELREATELADAKACLADPYLEPKGAIRYHADSGGESIHVYFWRLR